MQRKRYSSWDRYFSIKEPVYYGDLFKLLFEEEFKDMFDKDGMKVLTYDVPGIKKEDIKVTYLPDTHFLEIEGKTDERAISKKIGFEHDVEITKVELKLGVLTIEIKKIIPDEKKPKVIKIK